jgi:hypothetical protein
MGFLDHFGYTMRKGVWSAIAGLNSDERLVNNNDAVTISNATAYFGITGDDNLKLAESTLAVICEKGAILRMAIDAVAEQKRPTHSQVCKIFARISQAAGVVPTTMTLRDLYCSVWLSSCYVDMPILEFLTSFHNVLCDEDVHYIRWHDENKRICFVSSQLKKSRYFVKKRGLWEKQDGEFSLGSFLRKLERWGFQRLSVNPRRGQLDHEHLYLVAPICRGLDRTQRRKLNASRLTVSTILSYTLFNH